MLIVAAIASMSMCGYAADQRGFFGLKGPVKSVTYGDIRVNFSRAGAVTSCTNAGDYEASNEFKISASGNGTLSSSVGMDESTLTLKNGRVDSYCSEGMGCSDTVEFSGKFSTNATAPDAIYHTISMARGAGSYERRLLHVAKVVTDSRGNWIKLICDKDYTFEREITYY